jgi:hypothetical protein
MWIYVYSLDIQGQQLDDCLVVSGLSLLSLSRSLKTKEYPQSCSPAEDIFCNRSV